MRSSISYNPSDVKAAAKPFVNRSGGKKTDPDLALRTYLMMLTVNSEYYKKLMHGISKRGHIAVGWRRLLIIVIQLTNTVVYVVEMD